MVASASLNPKTQNEAFKPYYTLRARRTLYANLAAGGPAGGAAAHNCATRLALQAMVLVPGLYRASQMQNEEFAAMPAAQAVGLLPHAA